MQPDPNPIAIPEIVSEAVAFICEHEPAEGHFVGFSGGKDSIVTLELVRMAGVKHQAYYSMTGIDPPEVVRFIRENYPDVIFLKPKRTFWRDLSVNCPPSNQLRWCCTMLKKSPAWGLDYTRRICGIRKEESPKRAAFQRINPYNEVKRGFTEYYPIYHWTEADVWDFIESRSLPYPALYDEGFDRIGCIICPYHSTSSGKMHEQYRERWPKYFELWEKSIEKLYQKRISQGKIMAYPTSKEFLTAWYLNNAARWYKQEDL